jgi:hypothetical protein
MVDPGTYMCFKVRAVHGTGASEWSPNTSPYYACTRTPQTTEPPTTEPLVLTKDGNSVDTLVDLRLQASVSPLQGSQRRLNYISFTVWLIGLLCNAGVAAKDVRIISEGETVWTKPAGPVLAFGPSLAGVQDSATIQQFSVDAPVIVTGGSASIIVDFPLFTSRVGQGQNPANLPECQDQVGDVVTIELLIP